MSNVIFGMPNSPKSYDYTRYVYDNVNGTFTNKPINIKFKVPKDAELTSSLFTEEQPTITDGGESKEYIVASSYNADLSEIIKQLKPTRNGYTFHSWTDGMNSVITEKVPPCETNNITYTATWDFSAQYTFTVSPPSIIQNLDSEGELIEGSQSFEYSLFKGSDLQAHQVTAKLYDGNNNILSDGLSENTFNFNKNVAKIVFTETTSNCTYTVPVFTFEQGVSITDVKFFYHACNFKESEIDKIKNTSINWSDNIEAVTYENPNLWCKCVAYYGRTNKYTTTYYIVSKLTHSFDFSCDTDVISVSVDKDRKAFNNYNYDINLFFRDSYNHNISSVTAIDSNNISYGLSNYVLSIGSSSNPTNGLLSEDKKTANVKLYVSKGAILPTYITFTVTSNDENGIHNYTKKIYFNELKVEGIERVDYTNVSFPESILENGIEKAEISWSTIQPTQSYENPYAWTRITYSDGTQVHFRTTNYSLYWLGDKESHPTSRDNNSPLMYMDAYYNTKEHISYVYGGSSNNWQILAKGEHPHYELFVDIDHVFINTDHKGLISSDKDITIKAYIEYDHQIDTQKSIAIDGWSSSSNDGIYTFTKHLNANNTISNEIVTVQATIDVNNVMTKNVSIVAIPSGDTFNWKGNVNSEIIPTNSYNYMDVVYNEYDHSTYVYGMNSSKNGNAYEWHKLASGIEPTYNIECDTSSIVLATNNELQTFENVNQVINIKGTFDGKDISFGSEDIRGAINLKVNGLPNDVSYSIVKGIITISSTKSVKIPYNSIITITVNGYNNYLKEFKIPLSASVQGISWKWLQASNKHPTSPADTNKYLSAYFNTSDGNSYVYSNNEWQNLTKSINWKDSMPDKPQVLDAYYNTANGNAMIFDGTDWQTLVAGFKWCGSLTNRQAARAFEQPLNVYFDIELRTTFIYDGSKWVTIMGSDLYVPVVSSDHIFVDVDENGLVVDTENVTEAIISLSAYHSGIALGYVSDSNSVTQTSYNVTVTNSPNSVASIDTDNGPPKLKVDFTKGKPLESYSSIVLTYTFKNTDDKIQTATRCISIVPVRRGRSINWIGSRSFTMVSKENSELFSIQGNNEKYAIGDSFYNKTDGNTYLYTTYNNTEGWTILAHAGSRITGIERLEDTEGSGTTNSTSYKIKYNDHDSTTADIISVQNGKSISSITKDNITYYKNNTSYPKTTMYNVSVGTKSVGTFEVTHGNGVSALDYNGTEIVVKDYEGNTISTITRPHFKIGNQEVLHDPDITYNEITITSSNPNLKFINSNGTELDVNDNINQFKIQEVGSLKFIYKDGAYLFIG